MTYETVFLNTFLKQFKKLPGNVRRRVEQRVQELDLKCPGSQVKEQILIECS